MNNWDIGIAGVTKAVVIVRPVKPVAITTQPTRLSTIRVDNRLLKSTVIKLKATEF